MNKFTTNDYKTTCKSSNKYSHKINLSPILSLLPKSEAVYIRDGPVSFTENITKLVG